MPRSLRMISLYFFFYDKQSIQYQSKHRCKWQEKSQNPFHQLLASVIKQDYKTSFRSIQQKWRFLAILIVYVGETKYYLE